MPVPVTYTGRSVEVTDAMRTYFQDKLEKLPHIELATQVDIEIGNTASHRGAARDFYVRILLMLPKAVVRMKKEGADVYVLFDEMIPSLHKKMVHYKDNFRKWEGAETWPESAVVEDIGGVAEESSASAVYASYTPNVRRKNLVEMTPMSVTEAIERMELLDKTFFLFKDVQTNKIAVISKENGDYEMIVAD